jgi:acetoin utilization deacetylase AcuC-like enzyme
MFVSLFCEIAGFKGSPERYGHKCRMLFSLAEVRVALLLEGGYNLQSTSDCMVMCVRVLLKESLRTSKVRGVKREATAALLRVATYLLSHWNSIDVNIEYVMNNVRAFGGRL